MSARVARALLSVSDKSGLVDFANGLARIGVSLLSTGGTARALANAGLAVVEIGDYTGFPEMLDGRVKTLHPKVHGGILARREDAGHRAALEKHSIPTIDLVVVNLYPFRETVAKPGCTLEEAIENIDIGGPAMVRSAAKNWRDVGVVVDPSDYVALLAELETHGGVLSSETRFMLAQKAFSHTAAYDGAISNWLTSRAPDGSAVAFPDRLNLHAVKIEDLRYGENPHQQAAFYRDDRPAAGGIASCRQLQGKELSFNNIADSDAAWECVKSFAEPACVIVKHANPCGVAIAASSVDAYRLAFATDPTSAFGGVIAFNRPVDAPALEVVAAQFVEVLIAPAYTSDALAAIAQKKNVRVLEVPLSSAPASSATRLQAHRRRSARADRRCTRARARRTQSRHQTRADPRAARRPHVRVARGKVRQVERDRLLFAWPDPRHRRRTDEPGRFDAYRGHEGHACEPVACGIGSRVGCVLPVSRRARCRR